MTTGIGLQLQLYRAGTPYPQMVIHGRQMAITIIGDRENPEAMMTLDVRATGHDHPESVAKILEATARMLRDPEYLEHFQSEAARQNWENTN